MLVIGIPDGGAHSCPDRHGAGIFTSLGGARSGGVSWRHLWLAGSVAAAVSLAAQPVGAVHARAHDDPAWLVFHPAQYPFDLAVRSSGGDGAAPARGARTPESDRAARPLPVPAAPAAVLISPAEATALTPAVMTLPVPSPSSAFGPERVPRARAWFIAGIIILLARLVSVGGAVTVLGRFGASSFVVAAVALVFDLTWQMQASIFAVAAVTFAVAAPMLRRGRAAPAIGGRGPDALVGRVFRLDRPITGGEGMLTTGGTPWRITAAHDCAAGNWVKVVRADGTLLTVDPVGVLNGREVTGAS